MSKGDATASGPSVVEEYARLLALAAHEFRTPASVVGGYLRMLQKDTDTPLSERQRKMIDEAARSCARLVALVGELSDIGKLDSDTLPLQSEELDLFVQLEDVAANVHESTDREVRLQLSGSPSGARIKSDRQRLGTAFAAFFRALLREQPTAAVLMGDRRIVQTGDTISAVVVIAKEGDVQRAYNAVAQPFNENRGGVGLSLAIARRIVERTGGRVWAPEPRDEADRGLRSAAVISIPLAE